MLFSSKQCNELPHEVDVTTPARERELYELLDKDLLERLMRRTGTGAPVSIRSLAETAGIAHGTVGNLLTGEQTRILADSAIAICEVIGVDWPILFAPVGRSVRASRPHTRLSRTAAA